jgi:hypothetical protein
MALYAKRHMWNNAARLADENEGKFDVKVFLPYAEWLVAQDRYDEAMQVGVLNPHSVYYNVY